MNGLLTAIGIVLVAALATAFAAPLFIDWTAYRTEFETQASRLVGVPVVVHGAVEARLLPVPRVRFADVVVGEGGDAPRLEARRFSLDLAPMPLLKGEFRVIQMEIADGRLSTVVEDDGSLSLPVRTAAIDPSVLSQVAIERLKLDGLEVRITDRASGHIERLVAVSGAGEAVALTGPLKFEGSAVRDTAGYGFRLATGRFDAEGRTRVRLAVEPLGTGQLFEAEGQLTLSARGPLFDGTASLVRGAEGDEDGWRIAARVKADPRRIVAETLDLRHGPDDRALRLSGAAEVTLGAWPSATMTMSARQLDVDRALGPRKDAAHRPPLEALAAVLERFPALARPPLPLRAYIAADSIVLGGDLLQGAAADLASTGGDWTVERFEVRLPGANLRAAGRLNIDDAAARYDGSVALDASDLPSLLGWMDGSGDARRRDAAVRRLSFGGNVSAAAGAVAIEDLTLTADGEQLTGRLSWRTGEAGARPRIEAALKAERLDLDRLDVERIGRIAGFEGRTVGGADLDVKLVADRLVFGGVAAQAVDVDVSLAGGAADIRRLSVADLGGARLRASGKLSFADARPSGRLEADVQASRLEGLLALLRASPVPPALLDAMTARAGEFAPLSGRLVLGSEGGGTFADFSGTVGGTAVQLAGRAERLAADAAVEVTLSAAASESARLLRQLGIPTVPFDSGRPGELRIALSGVPARGAGLRVNMAAAGVAVSFEGTGRFGGAEAPQLAGKADMFGTDAAPLLVLAGRAPPETLPKLPVRLDARLAWSPGRLAFDGITGSFADRAVSGDLRHEAGAVGGTLRLERAALGDVALLGLGPLALSSLAPADPRGGLWSGGAVGPGPLDGLAGRVGLRIAAFDLGQGTVLREAAATLGFGANELALGDVEGTLAGGRFRGALTLRRAGSEATANFRAALEGADAGALAWAAGGAPVVSGRLDLAVDGQGAGHTPAEIVASLTGSGTITLRGGEIRNLDPRAFERVAEAVEKGLPLEPERLRPAAEAALHGGAVRLVEASSAFTMASGVLRASNAAIDIEGFATTGSASFNLSRWRIAGDATLAPRRPAEGGQTPQLTLAFAGPVAAPARTVDVTALTGFFTMRALEREVARVEKLEAERQERERQAREEAARLRAEMEQRRQAEEQRRQEEEARRQAEEERQRAEDEKRRAEQPAAPPLDPPREILPRPSVRSEIGPPRVLMPGRSPGSIEDLLRLPGGALR